jgi:hypothetical protein
MARRAHSPFPRRFAAVLLATMLLAPAALVLGMAPPAAADVSCTGTIGAQFIGDNIRVPSGASCTLSGTTVDGNVLVGRGARLTALNATINGNIQDDNGGTGAVQVSGSRIDGDIQIEAGTSVTVSSTRIDGNLQLERNTGPIRAERNTIDGDLQANQNSGGLTIIANTIGGNLQCQANNPAPAGHSNTVRGNAEGQCAGLTGAVPPPPSDPAQARENSIRRLYQAYFLREPDAGGLAYWTREYSLGRSLSSISSAFAASSEFRNRYGALDNAAFVRLVYSNVLGRSPDAGGFAFWVGALEQGQTRGWVMIGFVQSPEFRNRTGIS